VNEQLKGRFTGRFIVLDGPDGCGKSTQARLLTEWLQEQGIPVVGFRDPGGTVVGEKIREILLSTEHDSMDTRTEVLLYMAARAQLWRERIRPALEQGRCVVLDRWLCSTCAYQGYAGGFGMDKVMSIADDSLERVRPDLTIIIDVDLQTGSKRLGRALDRMEQKGDAYHEKVREGFLELAKEDGDFVVVDGTDEIDSVHQKIVQIVSGASFE